MQAAETHDPGGSAESTPTDDDIPELNGRGRWDGTVVDEHVGLLRWGTHRVWTRSQEFEDGGGNVQIAAPEEPPCYADLWVGDWLAGSEIEQIAAQILAKEWGLDIEEVRQ